MKVTSTRRLVRIGSTVTRPINELTSADSSGVSSTLGASWGAGAAGFLRRPISLVWKSLIIDTGVGGGTAVPLNSGMVPSFSRLTTRRTRSRPLRIRNCVL